ncbi:MAG TPA: MFS transporter [Aestuariivirgaceae bacterium]|nr:MFS transporter [Aestuariivirgaceae bacterium]
MTAGASLQWRNLVAACAAVAVFSFSLGEMFPLLSLKMEGWGISSSVIGLNTAMAPLGILLAGLVIPRLAHTFGSRTVTIAMATLTGLVILAYPAVPSIYAWFVLRLVQGMFVATLFALSEAWVVRFSEGPYRGRIVGIYASVISASFGLGAIVIKYLGIEGYPPFLAGALVMFLAVIPISMVDEAVAKAADEEEEHVSVRDFMPKAPMLVLAIAIHAIFDGGMLAFLSVYGVRNGYDIGTAALLLTVLALGNVFFQIPIGLIADKTSKQGTVKWCFAIAALCMLLIPFFIATPVIWPLVCLVGAANFGIYTVGLALLGDRFRGTDLVAGTATFATAWGFGSFVGSLVSGWAIDIFGPDGFPYSLAAIFALYLVVTARRSLIAAPEGP